MNAIEIIQLTIAICKDEVESVIGSNTINIMDNGSPWGRAFIKSSKAVNEYSTVKGKEKTK